MIFGIGAAAKATAEEIKHRRLVSSLEESCADAKRKYYEPLLGKVGSLARYDAASALNGGTLHLRMNAEAREEDRARLVDTYLNAMEKEYEMAKEELSGEPATRGQLVALGLAMHEFSLTYPRDLASMEARVAGQIAAERAAHRSELASVTVKLNFIKRSYVRAIWILSALFVLLAMFCGVLAFTLWNMGALGTLSG